MKKKAKISKKKVTKPDKKLHYSFNYIKMTLQQGDKCRAMWVEGNDVYKWMQKYYACRRKAKWAAFGIAAFFCLADAETFISLLKGKEVYRNEKTTLLDELLDNITSGILLFYLIMSIFFHKSNLEANKAMKKKLSEY